MARVFPEIGDRPIAQLRTSELQALVKKLSLTLAPGTVEVTRRAVAGVLRAAVVDRVLTLSPAVGVKLPRADQPRVQPPELGQVLALAEAMPARARAAVLFAAGSGLRLGEALGLTVDRVAFCGAPFASTGRWSHRPTEIHTSGHPRRRRADVPSRSRK
jgi:integrase